MAQRNAKEEARLRSLLDDKQILVDVLRQELEVAKQEKEIAEGQESRLMQELGKIRTVMTAEDDKERRYVLDLLEDKKSLLRETEELRCQLTSKTATLEELERRYDHGREQRRSLEDQISQAKKDLSNLTKLNKEALAQQRESFEARLKSMEEEVTNVSLCRYKVELEQKQRYLKASQKYESQIRDYRACLAQVLKLLDIKENDLPEGLRNSFSSDLMQII